MTLSIFSGNDRVPDIISPDKRYASAGLPPEHEGEVLCGREASVVLLIC